MGDQSNTVPISEYEEHLKSKELLIQNLGQQITALEAINGELRQKMDQYVLQVKTLENKNKAYEDKIKALMTEITADKSKRQSKSNTSHTPHSKKSWKTRGADVMKRVNKKFKEERDLSESSEGRSQLHKNLQKRKQF